MKSEPIDRDLTSDEAADILNVSVVYVIGLLNRSAISSRGVGPYQWINAADLLAYKQRSETETRGLLDELTTEAERLRLGY